MITAMNATNQTFNWNRLTSIVSKDKAVNWRKLGLTLLVMYLFFAFTLISNNWSSRGMKTLALDPMIVFLFISIIASMGFSGLVTKGKRIGYLALPASTAEKFVFNAVVYVIGGIVAVIACIYLADLTRFAILSFKQGDDFIVSGITAFADTTIKWVDMSATNYLTCLPKFLLNCLWYASMFMLGSILWPKRSFLKTAIVVFAYWMFMAYMKTHFVWSNGMTSEAVGNDLVSRAERLDQILLILDCVTVIVCWLVGWYQFKGKDVISPKWWNGITSCLTSKK